jgi:predicted nucleic acid-binding Zn ribbon protein
MKQRELNAALFALVLSVSRTPSVRAEIDAGLPEDSQTAAVLAEINGMVKTGAVNVKRTSMTAPQAKTRIKSGVSSRTELMPPRKCTVCGALYAPMVFNAKYCSPECRKSEITKRVKARKEAQKADTRPTCRLCDARFIPERGGIVYCKECRTNRAKEVGIHTTRAYQLRHPDLKRQRDREYRARKSASVSTTICERCGMGIALTRPHKRYCASCRVVVNNEHKRACDKKKSAIYKAAIAAGVSA